MTAKRFWAVLSVAVFVFFLNVSYLSAIEISSPYKTTKTVLDNGLVVIIREMPQSQYVATYATIKTGSATEGKFYGSGISHFVEHMLFKGTHSQEVGEISNKILSVGGSINAATSFDYTMYKISVPYNHFDIALNTLSDMLINPTMNAEEADKEREVIFGEMRLYKDNPDRQASQMLFETVYQFHPYRFPIIGYESLFEKISVDDLKEYFKTHYTANNTVLSVAGNVKTEDILPKIEEAFKDYPREFDIPRNLVEEPLQNTPRYVEREYPTLVTQMTIAYPSMRLIDPDLFALDVLSSILAGNRSSFLKTELEQKQKLVYSISAGNYTPMDKGFFSVDCSLDYANKNKVIKAVEDEIKRIQTKGVDKVELENTKRNMLASYIMSYARVEPIASSLGMDEAMTGDYNFTEKYYQGIQKVTTDDIIRVAKKYLQPEQQSIVILKPEVKKEAQVMSNEQNAEFKIEKVTLDNGLTILLKEDHLRPYVAMNTVLWGGSRFESKETEGLFSLLSALLVKGTKKLSSEDINVLLDERGMSFSPFSGRNALGIEQQFLSEDFNRAVDLLEDVLKNSTFSPESIEQVKFKLYAALDQEQDSIYHQTAQEMRKILFPNNVAFGFNQNGTKESITNITQEEIKKMYSRILTGNNLVISVVGDFDRKIVVDAIKKKFGSLPNTEVNVPKIEEKSITVFTEKTHHMDKQQAMVLLGFHGPTFYDADKYSVDLLTNILGLSFDGRLFKVVREELGKAYTLGGSYIPSVDAGWIYFYALTTEQDAVTVKERILSEVKRISHEIVSEKEFNDMKQYMLGRSKNWRETPGGISMNVALDERFNLGYDHYKVYEANINKITQSDLQKAAQKYLDINKGVMVVTLPLESNVKE